MKQKIALSALACIIAGSTLATGQTQVVWHNSLLGPDSYVIQDSVRLPGGDIVYVGDVERPAQTNLLAIRQDINGNTVWIKTFAKPGPAGDVFARRARLSPLTNNIVVASEVTGNATPRDIWMFEIDQNGNGVQDRQINIFNNDRVGDLEVGIAGNMFLGIQDNLVGTQPRFLKMLPNMVTMFTYLYGAAAAGSIQKIEDIEVDPITGDSVISGVVDNAGQADIGLDRIDQFGAVLYTKLIGDAVNGDGGSNVDIASDGSVYLAYSRSRFTVNELGRISKFDPPGVFQWNSDSTGMSWVDVAEMPSGDVIFAGSVDTVGGETRAMRFTSTGTLKWTTNVSQPDLDRNLLDKLAIDTDGTISTISHVNQTGRVDADWEVNSFMANGTHLYKWRYDTGVGLYDLPSVLEPVGNKNVIVGGYKSLFMDSDIHVFRLNPFLLVVPATVTVVLGRLNFGDVTALSNDDNTYLEVCKFIVPNISTPPVNIEVKASVQAGYPVGSITFATILKANTPSLQADVQQWDYVANAWGASTLVTFGTSEVTVTSTGDPLTNVEAVTQNVKARVRVKAVGPTTTNLWCVDFDQAGWIVTP
ncbi:MAG: hypothetical protein JNM34_04675 [Chthonomonadaceae bacterium]|nr:hypothetical protein [Chthonomonadaceae bacterium]